MRKYQIINRIIDSKIVAIVRTDDAAEAEQIAGACAAGGITVLEITFSVPDADKVISNLRRRFTEDQLLVGAGTVLDPETANTAYLAGARFIVSPSFNEGTSRYCNRYQIPYIPGCMTLTEMVTAMEAGVEIIKLFPAGEFSPRMIKAVQGPLPQALLMPTGGVGLENVSEWFQAGCAAVGVGGKLTQTENGDYSLITVRCREMIETINQACQG
ncbi:MAG: bifunctional 2-keto-4-hydroxyglutarate aldolase/2-keto-3-deoxy-6-phosphogluconate aldolase [Bacillota bacterium]